MVRIQKEIKRGIGIKSRIPIPICDPTARAAVRFVAFSMVSGLFKQHAHKCLASDDSPIMSRAFVSQLRILCHF